MSEWLKEHAWKTNAREEIKQLRNRKNCPWTLTTDPCARW